jgi:oxygen-independent coproporphyrinogen-3 oxidase
LIQQNDSAVVVETELTQQDRQAEAVFLGLRMMDGFSVVRYRELFGADIRETHASDLARFRDAGLIELSGDLVKLTRAGALMSNEVFAAFV